MKATNKIQKTALTVVAAGLVIFSFAAHAQHEMKSLFEDNETSNITLAMGKISNNLSTTAVHTRNFTGANAFATYLEEEAEEPLELENWMIEESSFASFFAIEIDTESPLQVEEWMTNEKSFDINMALEVASEEPMDVESWMADKKTFSTDKQTSPFSISTKTFFYSEVNTERPLLLEAWMINPNTWKN